MTAYRKWVGHRCSPRTVLAERGQILLFAKATGETNPLYTDAEAARARGFRDVIAPPTFLFCLASLSGVADDLAAEMDLPAGRILHGEQAFEYGAMIAAGDAIRLDHQVEDIFDKKDGALTFIRTRTDGVNQDGQSVGASLATVVVTAP